MHIAITREVSQSIGDCELTHLERTPINHNTARDQHAAYEAVLTSLGYQIERLPTEPNMPDSVFVEDVAVVLDEVAIITRPGALSRRDERPSIESALRPYRELEHITSTGILDGGDVLIVGRDIWIGVSSRSNVDAIGQFRSHVDYHGYQVHSVQIRDCLHLKSAVTALDDTTVLVNPARVNLSNFKNQRCIQVDPSEPEAANALRAGRTIVAASAFPRTAALIEAAGFAVVTVDASELAKAEGALTCCSLLFDVSVA
ncbi:MAG: arginine deiminase family protein [Acidimicrobiales bacterium]|nr:arginine deiminase family protein [Acidimicrobiales bacterium]